MVYIHPLYGPLDLSLIHISKSVFVKKTVREELLEMCNGRAANGAADRSAASEEEQILKIAELCEIDDLLDRHPYDLSGGEQQRTALAKVMLTDPKILLLDEPTKGMDSFFKQKFARVLKRLQTEGVTVVMVSHDVEFCARYADCLLYTSRHQDGRVRQGAGHVGNGQDPGTGSRGTHLDGCLQGQRKKTEIPVVSWIEGNRRCD